jgi:penicillin-binding protein 1A
VLDPERELRLQQRRAGNAQVISQQNAYIMSKILEKTVEEGTLANGAGWGAKFTFRDENGKTFRMPVAGKTGTPQNWSDAWAIGYSPYYTTAVWFGFDKPGNSLGVELTGSTLSGPVWGDYMRVIHQGLARRDFARPAAGIIDVTVCNKSGLLKTPSCNQGDVTLPFLMGTQPTQACDVHGRSSTIALPPPMQKFDDDVLKDIPRPTLPPDLFPDTSDSRGRNNRNNRNTNTAANNRRNTQNIQNTRSNPQTTGQTQLARSYNPLLDEDEHSNAAAPVNNVRENAIPDDARELDIPSYNPLLD